MVLAYEGLEGAGIPAPPQPPAIPEKPDQLRLPRNATPEQLQQFRTDKATQAEAYEKEIEKYHEENAEYRHEITNYRNEIDGYRNKAWGDRYGTIGDINRSYTTVNGTADRSMSGDDLALRMVLKTTGNSNLKTLGLSNDPSLSYDEAIEMVKTKSPKVQKWFNDKMDIMRDQSPVSYFDLGYHKNHNYMKDTLEGHATYADYRQLRAGKYITSLRETGFETTSKIELNPEEKPKTKPENDKTSLFKDNADDLERNVTRLSDTNTPNVSQNLASSA